MRLARSVYSLLFFTSFIQYAAQAQFIAYSQYNNVPLLTNPAKASLTDYTQLTFQYRRSRVATYQIPSVSFVMPLFRQAAGWRYAGIGVNVISQQAGPDGLYQVTGATGTFAYTIPLSNTSHIAGGIGGGIVNKRVDATVTTDSQFDFGAYDPSLPTGENFQSNSVTRAVINTGFSWVLTDAGHGGKASLGIAAYNINRPSFDLLGGVTRERVTYVVAGEFELMKRDRLSVAPTFRYINDGTSAANLGARVSYTPGFTNDVWSAGAWYKTTGAAVAAIQYEHKQYMLAASTDFSVARSQDVRINNAFELSLTWRLNRRPALKPQPVTAVPAPVIQPEPEEPPAPPPSMEKAMDVAPAPQPVPQVSGTPLDPEEEKLADVQIPFQLGSEVVSAEHDAFLDKLVAALDNHPDYQLRIIGHTCTVGDKATNEKVSYDRAEAVALKLTAKGVERHRLTVVGMDFQQPIADNDTEEGRRQNRRVEFEWIKK